MSEVVAPYDRYVTSGEINFRVDDAAAVIDRLEAIYGPDARSVDREDGLTVVLEDGWFNCRPSNTEPLLRLNVEGDDAQAMAQLRDAIATTVQA